MDFQFTEEQQLFADSVRKFAQAQLEGGALARAHDPRFPFDVAKLMAEQGLMGITIGEKDGGQGGSLMDAVIAIEQVASVCPRSSATCWRRATSTRRTVLSRQPAASRVPSGLNATSNTILPTGIIARGSFVSASQRRMVLSVEPEASKCPSALKATRRMVSVCPRSTPTRARVATSQTTTRP